MSTDNRISYWDTVNAIAAEIIEECGDDHEARCDRVHQDVDGSHWVIYTHANLKVIEFSETTPSETEWRSCLPQDAGWAAITAVVAFCLMEADVMSALGRLDAEEEEDDERHCGKCGQVGHNSDFHLSEGGA